jgi:chromosome segregation ATPase
MATLVTFESVAAAAEVIVATGKRPSVRTIAAALGGGSPNSILVHLRDWQSWRPVAGIADIDIDAQVIDGIKKQIQRTAARAAATAEEKAASTEDDLQAVSAEQAEAKQQITTLIDQLDKSKDQVNALTKQIDTERADAERFAQTAQLAYAAMREDIAKERQKSETIAAALVRSEVRLETLPKLESKIRKMEAEIETLRAAFDSMQQAKQQAEQAIAVANANLNAANQRTQDLLDRVNKAEAKFEEASLKESRKFSGL